ncbi:putative bifunctional diguanylate cyclase/phosphodiesterase [Roseibium aggregatum]|uniref:EAL domain-containing protein n=1 Tax=Roseibium aggregatum TaxID=187304 RepID=A0A939EAM8_9HYPH|nr:EAL domain-containing protein [Roseibium aggregatum]MBN9669665.1 EAL domain-containing protein [Roseibium aggregatum]
MENIRAFIRWMMIDPRHPDIAQAQYNELKTQIPSLYALLMVNSVAVAYTHFDSAPFYLTVGMLVPMLLVTGSRLYAWIAARNIVLGPEQAIRKMRQTVVLGSLVSVIFIVWSLSLDQFGGPAERGHVALFIGITVIGCIFCLMHLPQAALAVMFIVTVPYLIYYGQQGQDVYVAISLNIFLVCLVILQVLLNGYRGFCKLVRSQAALAAKQEETQRLNAENERLAQTDALTDLPNRRYFFNKLEALVEDIEGKGLEFAVGIVDLDRFKPINDTYGHQSGDLLLTEIGQRLKSLDLADVDVCRLGGDEFGFFYLGDLSRAAGIGQTICDRISEPYRIGDLEMTVGASCGMAFFPEAGTTAHSLFDRSDYALYNAKAERRGQTTVYSASHEARIRSERAIENALQKADLDDEFQIHFQPLVSLPDRTVIGFEALARWHSPELNNVSPDKFIPIAERSGQIHRLTIALFKKAIRQIQSLPGRLLLSFNLSAHDITSQATVETLLDIIKREKIDPTLITFEITETSVIGSYEAAEKCLHTLRSAGVDLALDDFGTGYSSLGYLHRLPIDCVKVDRNFIKGFQDPMAIGVITSILNLCRSMQMRCVVEGVEDESQLALLEDLNCELIQGFFFSPALSFDEVAQSVRTGRQVAGLPLAGAAQSPALQTGAH